MEVGSGSNIDTWLTTDLTVVPEVNIYPIISISTRYYIRWEKAKKFTLSTSAITL